MFFYHFNCLQAHINERFSKLAESLYIADRKARESVQARAQLEKKMAVKEKEAKESKLRELAQRARYIILFWAQLKYC